MVLLLPAWAALLVSEEIAGRFVLVLGWSPASGARGRPFRLQEREGSSDWKPGERGRGLSLEGPGGEPRQDLVGVSFAAGPPPDSSVPAQVSGG